VTDISILFIPVGPKGDHISAKEFLCDMFMRGIPPKIKDCCFSHFICATDTENIKTIFEDVKNNIFTRNVDDDILQ